jgi:Protein of unknown function (DUF2786)
MSSEKEKILDKIKKLLRMKRGGTQAEVETALALAAELARKHAIDLDSVDPDAAPAQPIGHIDAITAARIQWECKYAGLVCQEFFNITLILRQQRKAKLRAGWPYLASDYMLTFIGIARDIEIALYVYHFLIRHFRHCWNTGKGRCRHRQAFIYGMYLGLSTKLCEQREQQVNEAGLIRLDRHLALRADYEKANFGSLGTHNTTPDCDAMAAKRAGFVAGRATQIPLGLGPTGQPKLLILDH